MTDTLFSQTLEKQMQIKIIVGNDFTYNRMSRTQPFATAFSQCGAMVLESPTPAVYHDFGSSIFWEKQFTTSETLIEAELWGLDLSQTALAATLPAELHTPKDDPHGEFLRVRQIYLEIHDRLLEIKQQGQWSSLPRAKRTEHHPRQFNLMAMQPSLVSSFEVAVDTPMSTTNPPALHGQIIVNSLADWNDLDKRLMDDAAFVGMVVKLYPYSAQSCLLEVIQRLESNSLSGFGKPVGENTAFLFAGELHRVNQMVFEQKRPRLLTVLNGFMTYRVDLERVVAGVN
jgi:hypothetical protein